MVMAIVVANLRTLHLSGHLLPYTENLTFTATCSAVGHCTILGDLRVA